MSAVASPVSQALKELSIPHRLFTHPGPVASLEQAARERGQEPDQIVRSIVFRVTEGDYAMVLIAGPHKISWKALRPILNQKRLSLATEEEVLEVTGYRRGAVGPLGLPQPMRILVDQNVLQPGEISLGSGVKGTTVILQASDLMKALGDVEVVDVKRH